MGGIVALWAILSACLEALTLAPCPAWTSRARTPIVTLSCNTVQASWHPARRRSQYPSSQQNGRPSSEKGSRFV